MKLSKLMLSALAAVLVMVSCTKENHTPEETSLKTVQLSLQNIIMTKGLAGDKINANDAVAVSNFKVFLTDGSYSPGYTGKNADGSNATFYFTSASDLSKVQEFHYVDHKCTKVVVVANAGDISFEQVMNLSKGIGEQQDQKSLILYGEQDLSNTGRVHTVDGSSKYTQVFSASVALKPTIARFEVDGFVTKFSDTPKFNTIAVDAIAFQHYFPVMKTTTNEGLHIGGSGDHVVHIADLDDASQVFGWFNGSSSNGWFIDRFTTPLAMTKDNPKADTPNTLAYHFYAGQILPQMIIKLQADGSPAHLYAGEYKKSDGKSLTVLEAGKIYRMSAAGEVASDGSIEIPDDIDPLQRCLEIKVEVVPWVVEIIAPQF